MFSDCEDDLCIFVCGTCKRYFTQLSAFSQHKKEGSCKRKLPSEILFKSNVSGDHSSEETSEEAETDENGQGVAHTLNDHFVSSEDAHFNSQQRKYPRKQDKRKIKRTVRDLGGDDHHIFSEDAEPDSKSESPRESIGDGEVFSGSLLSMVSYDSHPQVGRLFVKTLERVDGTCQHPVYVCKTCHAEFANSLGRVFKCLHCRRGFFSEAELKRHIVNAKHDNLCNVCGKIFPDKYKLKKHALSHVTEKNFRCEVLGCTKAFKSANDLKRHVKYVHATEKRYKCAQCSRAFSRPDKYRRHMLTHAVLANPGLRSIKAKITDGVRPSEVEMSGMMQTSDEEAPGRAVAAVVNGLGLARNNENHTVSRENNFAQRENNAGSLTNKSSHCFTGEISAPSSNQHELNNDVLSLPDTSKSSVPPTAQPNGDITVNGGESTKSHTSEDEKAQDRCEATNRSFASSTFENEGDQHVATVAPKPSSVVNSFPWKMNGDSVATTTARTLAISSSQSVINDDECKVGEKESLGSEVRPHPDPKSSAGRECGRCKTHFLTPREFLAHEERCPDHIFRCEWCSGKFLNACELHSHQRECHGLATSLRVDPMLAEEGPPAEVAREQEKHKCPDCGKVFTRADKLRRHAIIHSPDRPCIPCKCRDSHGCKLTFYRLDSMKRHVLIHSREKPYKCDLCSKTFSRPDYVTKHVSHVHKRDFKHRCPLCDYGTCERKRLRIHIKSRHEMDPDDLLPPLDLDDKIDFKENAVTPPPGPLENLRNATGISGPTNDMTPTGVENSTGRMASPGDMVSSRDIAPAVVVASREFVYSGTEQKVEVPDIMDPLVMSGSLDIVRNSIADVITSEYVDDKPVGSRLPSSVVSESSGEQYNLSKCVEHQNQIVASEVTAREDSWGPGDEQYAGRGGLLNTPINERKTPLNSRALPSQESSVFWS